MDDLLSEWLTQLHGQSMRARLDTVLRFHSCLMTTDISSSITRNFLSSQATVPSDIFLILTCYSRTSSIATSTSSTGSTCTTVKVPITYYNPVTNKLFTIGMLP